MDAGLSRTYSVTEITLRIKAILENEFPIVSVQGELSNVRPSSSGHLYFVLKDEETVISAVMFRSRFSRLKFEPADGMLVKLVGNISVYGKRGTYQIICESMEPAGVGDILAMLEERKRRLAAEGLFNPDKKKPLPMFPKRVAVVTSPTGAALRDILNVLARRSAGVGVVVVPAPVQGDGAAERIAAQIRRADHYGLGEVVIVGRGGGSLEDLLPFSEEVVVRAIADCNLPVISAVGHEIDTPLSDLAADYRAPTPSAAAEVVTARREDLLTTIGAQRERIVSNFVGRVERARLLINRFSAEAFERAWRVFVQPKYLALDDAKERVLRAMESKTLALRHRLGLAKRTVEACSPFEVLERGYALVYGADGGIVRDAAALEAGERIETRFAKGSATAQVVDITKHNGNADKGA